MSQHPSPLPEIAPTPLPRSPEVTELRRIRIALTWLLVVVAFTTVYFARDLLLPVFMALLLALTFSPVVRTLRRMGIPAYVSATLLMLMIGVSGFAMAYFASGPISDWMRDLPEIGNTIRIKLQGLLKSVETIREVSEDVEKMAAADPTGPVREVAIDRPSLLNFAASGAMRALTTLLLALLLALFLLASGSLFHEKIIQSFTRFQDKKRALTVVLDVEKRISRYLFSITVINAALGACIAGAMWLIGMPSPLIWGLIAFLLNYLPFIGAMVGTVVVAGVALISIDEVGHALMAPAAYYMLTAIEGNIITPTLLGRRLELNTVAVFLAVFLWGWLWSVPGALMAVPFLVTFKVICDNVPGMEVVGNFLSSSRSREP